MNKYKEGDWILFEFKVCQIIEMKESYVTKISDGIFNTGGNSLNYAVRPLTLTNLRISYEYEHHSNWLHQNGSRVLNFPDIHRHLVGLWTESCDDLEKDIYRKLNTFMEEIKKQLEENEVKSSQGVKLFR